MNSIDQLEACTNELSAASRSVMSYCRNSGVSSSGPQLPIPSDAPDTVHQARRSVLANAAEVQVLLGDSIDFLQQTAVQTQMLACLQWLSSCQVLVCLPLCSSLPIKDLAQLCCVPETQLSRVLRLMATAGFLQEPQPGRITHTYLSNLFVSQRRFRDAAAFLVECCVPSALRIASMAHHQGAQPQGDPDETAYKLAFGTSKTFRTACSLLPKLQLHGVL